MAASDPAFDVPTPTGTLRGVAVFSWDGAAWQPAGRAGPNVATPTGVLRGVAQFPWEGAWQPAGRAQPGVATSSGVLDGVAVYTWNGSAWTPAGGTMTPSTPSGSLRGVAAFSWDGTAWQPAAQAGPSVATPYGVLEGVALFNWNGAAWAAASTPSLDLDFMTPGTLDGRITFTRASTATYFDNTGTMQTAATNTPRWDYNPNTLALNGLLIEEARTNILLNSAALGTQSVAVTAQAYTLSFYGTGTIALTGASTAGPLVGMGTSPTRVSLTFTPAAGTLTCTVAGSVINAQLEAGAFSSSYISTAGAAATRAVDIVTQPTAAWFNSGAGTARVEYSISHVPPSGQYGVFLIDDASTNNRGIMYFSAGSNLLSFYGAVGNVQQINVPSTIAMTGAPQKAALCYGGATWQGALAGVTFAGNAGAVPLPATRLVIGGSNTTPGVWALNGYIRRISYWSRTLSNAEMQAVTA